MCMFKRLFFIPFLFLCEVTVAQISIKMDPDSIKFLNAELIIRNKTKDVTGYLYNTGDGKTIFKKFGKTIQFKVGTTGFPSIGDSTYQNAVLANYFIKVLRNGLLQYRDSIQGVKVDDATGKVTFYPALQNNDQIYIEAITGIDFSINGTALDAGSPPIDSSSWLKSGAFDNGNRTFTLRWNTNAKTLYLSPKVVGIGSSTLAGYGLTAPERLGDKILAWLNNNTSGAVWENISVAGYSSKDLLSVQDGGVLGHNIETALSMNPDFIFVSLPSNDPATGISVDQSIINLKKIDAPAQLKGVPVFFETTQPRTNYTALQQGMLKQLADSIRVIWPDRYVEGFKDVADPATPGAILAQYDNGDGVHLNSAGNQFIANNLFERWMDYFKAVKGVKRYVLDSSLDKTNWSQFTVEPEPNVIKKTYPRFNQTKQYFRVKAELKNGTYTAYSNIAPLEEVINPEIPGVDDYSYRLLVDLGGDGTTTLNGSNAPDGKPTPSPDGSGKYWNNWYGIGGVTGFADKSSITQIKTTTNAATDMSMQIIGLPQGTFGTSDTKSINYSGFTVPVGDYPYQSAYDNMFIHSSVNPNGITLRIKGLTKTNSYYIKLWGARLDDGATPRTLQAKLGAETWATAQSVDTKYPTTGTPDYNRAVIFNNITGADSVDIVLRAGGTSTFAHVSLVDIGVMGTLPLIPQIKLRDTAITTSTLQLTANPINGANIASYQWSQLSGPNNATLGNASNVAVNLSGLTNGTFVFRVSGTATDGKVMTADATVKVFPYNDGKKTMRVHFSKTAVTPIPGWFNVYGVPAGNHIMMTDPETNWTVDNVSDNAAYWSPYAGNSASNTDGSTTGTNGGIIPDIVLQGIWYNYSLKYAAGMDNLLLKGLNPSKTYTVRLYASRNNTATAPRYGCWRINGGSEMLQNALNNTNNTTLLSDVLPDANGTIKISVHAPTNAGTYGTFSYINAVIVVEN